MNSTLTGMISYAFLLIAAGLLAYLHLLPVDLLVATFYLVAGHAGANLPSTLAPSANATPAAPATEQKQENTNAPAY